MRKAGSKIIKSAQRALGYARGENCEGFVAHVPEEVDVKSLRKRKGLTQSEFALRFGFDVRALQDWEQKRRYPDRAARVLLTVIDHEPEAVSRALGNDDFSVVRYNCDGTPDTTFGTGGNVKSLRKRQGLTQAEFSLRFGFDVRALQDWEQKRRSPDRAARVLLTVINHDSEAVSRAMAHCPEPSSLLAMA